MSDPALDLPPGRLLPLSIDGVSVEDLRVWLEQMILIRRFEEALEPLAAKGLIPGGSHLAIGQEAVAVGAMAALAPEDVITSSHRPHHHALAKGIGPRPAMAELFGRADGCAGGRGGSMHLADPSVGHYGSNGIVGAGLGLATGVALAARMRGESRVSVGFFGDGAINTGRTWEAINLAALWDLPLIAVCENNRYAVETPITAAMAGDSIVERAAGFGLPAEAVDGQDVVAMHRAVARARARAAAGDGPTFIEAVTYRYDGHNTGEVITYRTDDEVAEWRNTRDPIARLAHALAAVDALTAGDERTMIERSDATVADAVAFADASPWPEPSMAYANVLGLDTERNAQ